MTTDDVKWKERPYLIAAFAVIAAALVFGAWDALVEMERIWGSKEEYGYAYIIPFITLYFIWQRRYKILHEEFYLSWTGAFLLLVGLFIQLMGVLSATFSIIQYGFLVALISSIWMLLGWRAFKVMLGPLMLLFLVVPLPAFFFNNLSSFLQLISSQIGVWVIRIFGISVYLEGNVIDLGVYQLQVVEACSGLRYLFPLFSLSLVAAFIYKAAMWKRVIIVMSSLPITVLMNSFRIGVIGVLVEYYGIEQAEGFLHDFEGWIIFMACTGILVLEMWLLLKIGPDKISLTDAFTIEEVKVPDNPYKNNQGTIGIQHIAAAVIVVAMSLSMGLISEKDEIIPERELFSSFPLVLDDWHGQRGRLDSNVLEYLKLTDYFIADYIDDSGKGVNLYIAYYSSQKSGEAAHSPRSCIPGGGWRINKLETVNIDDVEVLGKPLSVNRLLIKKGDHGQLVYYWFQQRNRIITNEYLVKWYLFLDAFMKNRTDGALIRLTTAVRPGEDLQLADNRLISFAKQAQHQMDKYIPR